MADVTEELTTFIHNLIQARKDKSDALFDYFHPDCYLAFPSGPVNGIEAYREYVKKWNESGKVYDAVLDIQLVSEKGGRAYVRANFSTGDGTKGLFLVIIHKFDGKWKVVEEAATIYMKSHH